MFATLVEQALEALSTELVFAIASIPLLIVIFVLWRRGRRNAGIPRIGPAPGWFSLSEAKKTFISDGPSLIEAGYQNFKDSMFKIQTADMERIVLSNKYVDEIRTAPESLLSVREGMCERHLGEFTTLDIIKTSHLQNDVCKGELTKNLSKLVPLVHEEAVFGIGSKLGTSYLSPQTLKGYEFVLGVVAGITSRVFVGYPLCRNEEWLKTAIGYTLDVFQVSMALRPWPRVLRPVVAPFLESRKRLMRHVDVANKYLGPIFEQRLAEANQGKEKGEEPLDMIQWMVNSAEGKDRDPKILSVKMLFLTLAAVHTSTMSATHALFDLCAMPEYIEPLRKEAEDALATEGGWSFKTIQRLERLDSFMKESQRLNHPGLLSFNRKVMSPLTLSDGTKIPEDSFITMPTNSIAQDTRYYPDADNFDGFRFYEKRQASKDEHSRHRFVSTSAESLPFGHGKFACPGRHFAALQIQMTLSNILMSYDVSYPNGQKTRPGNIFSGEGVGPDRTQEITFTPLQKA